MIDKTYILGAGLGGLSAAIWQRISGQEVTVIEKYNYVGGKVAVHSAEGFSFDIGPTLLTMPFVFEELFTAAGKNLSDFIDIYKLDTICKYFWEDGQVIDAKHDPEEMQKELAKISLEDSKNYEKYLDYTKNIYDISAPVFLFSPFARLKDYLNQYTLSILPKLPKLDAWRSVHKANQSFYNHPKIIQLFDRYATYNGSNPYSAPATLNIITHVEYSLGSYGVKDGTRSIATALFDLAKELGVKFKFDEAVKSLKYDKTRITEINTISNTYNTEKSNVISNMDVVNTYKHLIKSPLQYVNKLEKIEPSLSGYIMLWGIEGKTEKLDLHNILFSNDYEQEFKDIFENKIIGDDPTFYISISSRHAKDDAPEGCESWFILINAPYLPLANQDEIANYNRLKKILIKKLKKAGIEIENKIRYEKYINQQELYNRYNSNKGSIYGTSSNSQFAAFKRPSVKDPNYKNLFFCGGSSHPGGGMPLVALSGKHASTMANYSK